MFLNRIFIPAMLAISLAACGGGGGTDTSAADKAAAATAAAATAAAAAASAAADTAAAAASAAATPAAAASPAAAPKKDLAITVIDGPIEKATVCLDKNLNGVCDTGEPTGPTDASGKVTLQIDPADEGKYPVLSIITAGTSIDADTGPVTTSFTLTAPADKPTVVTPLTTLVVNTMKSNGLSSTDAAKVVQEQTGITISLFEDFSKSKTADAKTAATIARAVVVTTQEQSKALASAAGTKDSTGTLITAADLDKLIQAKIAEMLPSLVRVLSDPTVQAAIKAAQDKIDATTDPKALKAAQAEKDAAIQGSATKLVKDEGATSDGVAIAITVQKAPVEVASTAAPTGFMNLKGIFYGNATNFGFRLLTGSAAQNTVTNGVFKYVDRRYGIADGAVATWNTGKQPRDQSKLHWNGKDWVRCALNFENTATPRDPKGANKWNYCDGLNTGSDLALTSQDISGQVMADALQAWVKAGYTSLAPSDALIKALDIEKFPNGSKVFMGNGVQLNGAPQYGTGDWEQVWVETSVPCAWNNPTPSTYTDKRAASLEEMITKFSGKDACKRAQDKTTTGKNGPLDSTDIYYAWGDTSIEVTTFGSAATGGASTASSFYTGNIKYQVAFATNNVAIYYACQQRYDGGIYNCTEAKRGTYAIEKLGDARVMSLYGQPATVSLPGVGSKQYTVDVSWTPQFIERGGKVYWGWRDNSGTYKSTSLNTTATLALLKKLGVEGVFANQPNGLDPVAKLDPETPMALTGPSYQGTYNNYDSSDTALMNRKAVVYRNANGTCGIEGLRDVVCTRMPGSNPAAGESITQITGTIISNGLPYNSVSTTKIDFLTGIGTSTSEGNTGKSSFIVVRR